MVAEDMRIIFLWTNQGDWVPLSDTYLVSQVLDLLVINKKENGISTFQWSRWCSQRTVVPTANRIYEAKKRHIQNILSFRFINFFIVYRPISSYNNTSLLRRVKFLCFTLLRELHYFSFLINFSTILRKELKLHLMICCIITSTVWKITFSAQRKNNKRTRNKLQNEKITVKQ